MAIEWTPALAVGVDKIDQQHRMLFQKVNELI
ncbi:MAG: hemerythrin, partial [Firmicutes bacterium]|nr:hemerythrin [Bacillota bacterium]